MEYGDSYRITKLSLFIKVSPNLLQEKLRTELVSVVLKKIKGLDEKDLQINFYPSSFSELKEPRC